MSSSGGLLTRPLVVFVQNAPVQVTKLSSTDGFVVVDLPHASTAAGVVRCARKILVDGAENLARTATYSFAAFELPHSGASAGINADGDGRDAAVAAALEELASHSAHSARGSLWLDAGKGITADELARWLASDPRRTDIDEAVALASGVVAAAAAALGSLEGATVAVEPAAGADALAAALAAAGAAAQVRHDALTAPADVLCVGSKVGVVDHDAAASVQAGLVVPFGPIPITARGLAVARRGGARVLADFVTTAAPMLARWDTAAESADAAIASTVARIGDVVRAAAADPDGDFLGACHRAEGFLRTWCEELPFGRPLA